MESSANTMEDDGQEEWLSDELLTDDDNLTNQSTNNSQTSFTKLASEDRTPSLESFDDSTNNSQESLTYTEPPMEASENIEHTLNNLENTENIIFPDNLNEFLIKKSDAQKSKIVRKFSEDKSSNEDEDGNDTDELLQVLSGGNEKSKKQVLKKMRHKISSKAVATSDEEDDLDLESDNTIKISKDIVFKRSVPKAESEDITDEEFLDDDEDIRKMFTKDKSVRNKSNTRVSEQKKKSLQSNKASSNQNKSASNPKKKSSIAAKKQLSRSRNEAPRKKVTNSKRAKEPPKSQEELKKDKLWQKIMEPETMDEEMLSDEESLDEPEVHYDEFSSTASEDDDQFFTYDLRCERAGDFIPLLGNNAARILAEEKKRSESQLQEARRDLAQTAAGVRLLAQRIRDATVSVAELDAQIQVA